MPQHRLPSGSTALHFRLRPQFVLPPHFRANVGSPARPNELRTRKTFGVCRTQMPQCTCMYGPSCPHFAGTQAKGKRNFRTNWQRLAFFENFRRDRHGPSRISQLICQISRLIFNRSHVNASHDVPACKVIDLWTIDDFVKDGDGLRSCILQGRPTYKEYACPK